MRNVGVYQRSDGRTEARIPIGTGENGKPKFRYILRQSRDTVLEAVEELLSEMRSQKSAICSLSFGTVFEERYLRTKHKVKKSTAANYRLKADKHILPWFGDKTVSSITSDAVYHFMDEKKETGLSLRYIADIVILLKSAFKYAVRTYHIDNPMDGITMPKCKKPEVQIIDEQLDKQLQDYIAAHENNTTLGVALTMSARLRIGELCALTWADIDLEKRILMVRKTMQRIQCQEGGSKTKLIITDPKSESSKRDIPIPECMIGMLQKYKADKGAYLLSGTEKPVEPRTMQYRFAAILKKAGLPSVHFHALRHGFATRCVKLGFDIKALSELLGHSSVEITLNRYVHSSFEQKQDYMSRVKFDF